MPGIAKSIVVAGLATALALPVAAGAPEHKRPAALEGSSITWCGDVEQIYADPEAYRDSPVYVNNEQLVWRVRKWAKRQPGYEGVWVDRDHLGWVTLAFSQDADQRQADLLERFPDVGVVAIPVEHTDKELRKLKRRVSRKVGDVLRSWVIGTDITSNVVELDANVVTDELVTLLESNFAGTPLCVNGPNPEDLPAPGAQPTEGDGWQLVGHLQSDGPSYRTGIATDQSQLEALWATAGMPGEVPELDFTDDVVLWFAEPHGSSCSNLRLDDVIVDDARSLVYPLIVMPDAPMMCTADLAGAYQYFVALERNRLPESPFMIQLGPDDPPRGAPKLRTVVEIDLSDPGVVAEKGDVHPDRGERQSEPERSGTVIEPFGKTRYEFDVRCGIGYLGEVNDIHWVTDETDIPRAWMESVDDESDIVVTVRLRGGPDPHVTATANGRGVRYEPVQEAPPSCDV